MYYLANGARSERDQIRPQTRVWLETTYRPCNERLHGFLTSRGHEVSGWLKAYGGES